MPTPHTILIGLTRIANDAAALAVVWHLVALVAIIALSLGWRPSRRRAGALLAAPVASVSVLAFAHDNPFNGIVSGAIAVALLGLASRLPRRAVERSSTLATLAGAAMIAFGWVYPHFLEGHSAAAYLLAAPMGLVPCPTLALVIGFALVGGGLGSRPWSLALAGAGLFYGIFGVARLGVWLDVPLMAGAVALLAIALLPHHRSLSAPLPLLDRSRAHHPASP